MLDKIGVKDSYNLVPGLFDHSGFVKSHNPQVEILPTQCHESFQHSHCLTVFVDSEPDIHCAHEHFAQQQHCRPNNVWAVSATSPSIKYQFDTVVEYWSNLVFTVINNPNIVPVDIHNKNKLANVLLGGYMPNRTKIFEKLQDSQLLDHCLVNYQPRAGQQDLFNGYRTPLLNQLDSEQWNLVATDATGFFSMKPLGSLDQPGWQSQKISRSVYNYTWLCVVAETENLGQLDTFLPSEKIAKPLLLAQPFLVQSSKGFLQQLKTIGFKTFGQWFNEDYDTFDNVDQRISAMINSLIEFHQQSDQQKHEMLADMKPVLEHNRNLILNIKDMTLGVANCIRKKLTNL